MELYSWLDGTGITAGASCGVGAGLSGCRVDILIVTLSAADGTESC